MKYGILQNPNIQTKKLGQVLVDSIYKGYKYSRRGISFIIANNDYGTKPWFIKGRELREDNPQFNTKKDALRFAENQIDMMKI